MKKIVNFKDVWESAVNGSIFLRKENLSDTIEKVGIFAHAGILARISGGSVIAAATTAFNDQPVIIVDEFFARFKEKYGKEFAQFIIGHELGHIKNYDVTDENGIPRENVKRSLKSESMADIFAMEYFDLSKDQTVYVLTALYNEFPWYAYQAKKELKQRIKIIEAL